MIKSLLPATIPGAIILAIMLVMAEPWGFWWGIIIGAAAIEIIHRMLYGFWIGGGSPKAQMVDRLVADQRFKGL